MTDIVLPKLNQTGTNEWEDVEANDRAIRDVVNGALGDDNIAASAGIALSKLAQGVSGAVTLSSGATSLTSAEFASTGAVTLTFSGQDIPSCTYTTPAAGTYLVIGAFDLAMIPTSGGASVTGLGQLVVNGVAHGRLAVLASGSGTFTTTTRATVYQTWLVTPGASQVLKLQAFRQGDGTGTCAATHTSMVVQRQA